MLVRNVVALMLLGTSMWACALEAGSSSYTVKRGGSSAGDDDDDTTGAAVDASDGLPSAKAPKGAGMPCDIATLIETKCLACHGETPTPGAQSSLVTITDLLAPAKSDASKSEAAISLARMKDTASPMPPVSYSNPVTAAEIAAFDAWIKGNYQGSCNDAGTPGSTSTSSKPPANLSCTSCHGDPNRTAVTGADPMLQASPPRNTKGETGATAKGVGAHQTHLTKGSMSKLIACNDCHVVPTSTSHSNGIVGLTFGTLAKTGNKTPAYDGTSCSGTYCHGNFTGGKNAAPKWTDGPMTCTSCHEAPPATGDHRRGDHDFECFECHGTGFTSTTVNKALHVNGVKDVGGTGSKIKSYNAGTRSCSPSCHGTKTW